jgi:heterodisulfide reductase subunit A
MDKCIACGLCAEKCPKKVPDVYDGNLSRRKAIYVPYAQAVPLKYMIDPEHCIYFKNGKCKACEKFCPTQAIKLDDQEKQITLNVGAVVVAQGSRAYDPAIHDTFGYTQHPNIVTSLEFERILSASGPYGGHLVRPSDKKEPEKIAWLQCIGSRDEHLDAQGYCSGVCCTYAIKEAMLAKEHSRHDLDTAIFYIDIRTHGKDFETYYNRAKDEGVRFVKSKITRVSPADETGRHLIRYVDAWGKRVEEAFDIVVLSVGLMVGREGVELAQRLGVDLNPYRFAQTGSFDPVASSKPGIYVCGSFQAPKDIPSSVMDSSAAAGVVGTQLAESRWSLTKTEHVPDEIDLQGKSSRVGVFVCRCGTNIAGVVDVPAVVEFAKTLPGVVYAEENLFSCSQDTQDKMSQVIKEHQLNRVVVAACTPKTHEPLFQETLINAGINKYLFEMANIRNQCSWVHKDDPEKSTEKAKDLVRMAVSKAGLLEPLTESIMPVNPSALVVGGGVAGMTAAKNLSGQGFQTFLIEKTDALGGQARHVHHTWRGEDVQEFLVGLIDSVESDRNIEVFLNSRITQVEGFIGNFKTTITQNGQSKDLEHGVTIIASGASELKPDRYLYGRDSRVVTGLELQQRFMNHDPALEIIHTAVFIQCVGSRIPERPYCSRVCCTQSINSALELKTINPRMNVFILHRDMRAYGFREDLYRKARSAGIVFIRRDMDKELTVESDREDLKVSFGDQVLGRSMEIRPDLLILASAMVPDTKTPLARLYKVSLNDDGFFAEAHVKLRPVDFATDGIFVCGLAHAPKSMDESIAQAQAAAARAVTILAKDSVHISPLVSQVDVEKCDGCGVCAEVCPFGAIILEDTVGAGNRADYRSKNIMALCKGCGLCAASCPQKAIDMLHFRDRQIVASICSVV